MWYGACDDNEPRFSHLETRSLFQNDPESRRSAGLMQGFNNIYSADHGFLKAQRSKKLKSCMEQKKPSKNDSTDRYSLCHS